MHLAILLAFLGGIATAPVAGAATDWCNDTFINVTPTTTYSDDQVPVGLSIGNRQSTTLNLSTWIRFDWENQPIYWGTMALPPLQTKMNTFSKIISATPGDHALFVTLQGQLQGQASVTCAPISRFVRLTPLPLAPSVQITANTTTGQAPFATDLHVSVQGGVQPVTVNWTFGDGTTANGSMVRHEFQNGGSYVVQVMVTDARGRVGLDRLTLTVTKDTSTADLPVDAMASRSLGIFAGILIVTALVSAVAAYGGAKRGRGAAYAAQIRPAEPPASQPVVADSPKPTGDPAPIHDAPQLSVMTTSQDPGQTVDVPEENPLRDTSEASPREGSPLPAPL